MIGIKFAPLSLIDVYSGSSYRGGIDLRTGSFGFSAEAGGYFRNWNGMSHIKGHLVKAELRLYDVDQYFGLEVMYKRQTYTTSDSITLGSGYKKDYDLDKYISCVTLKTGQVFHLTDRLYLDAFAGLGVRIKNVHLYGLTEEEKLRRYYYNDSGTEPLQHGEGKKTLLNIDLGVKIGFIIVKS